MKRRFGYLCLVTLLFCLTGCAQAVEYKEILFEMNGEAQEQIMPQPETISLSDVVSFEEERHSTYAYESLSEAQRIWYEDINTMLAGRSDQAVALSKAGFDQGLGEADIDLIFQSVLIDHPEYFYVEGYEYSIYSSLGKFVGIEVKGSYSLTLEECMQRRTQMDEAVDKLLANAPVNGSEYEKIKYVYETIIYGTEYCMEAEDNQNIYSVLVGQASVCQGYAKATQYLLNLLDVECTLVYGMVNAGEGHTWNLVKADGDYYYVDATWGDASYLTAGQGTEGRMLPDINYDYLCITTGQLMNTHKTEHPFPLPDCDTLECNYYVKEGCLFEAYDEEQLKREIEEAQQEQKGYLTIKCKDTEVYAVLLQELIDKQRIFEYFQENCETVAYIENEQQLSLTFWMTN